jgi:hypothetical protein
MTGAPARSLLDQHQVIRYAHLLINRTQINAIAETDDDLVLEVRPEDVSAPHGRTS